MGKSFRRREHGVPLGRWPIDQVLAVKVQDVEYERSQRQRCAETFHVQPTPQTTGADLKRVRPSVCAQREGLAVQDQRPHRQPAGHLDKLRHPAGDVVQAAGEDAHIAAEDMDLHPRTVELPFDRRR